MDRIGLIQDRDKWQAVVNVAMNLKHTEYTIGLLGTVWFVTIAAGFIWPALGGQYRAYRRNWEGCTFECAYSHAQLLHRAH